MSAKPGPWHVEARGTGRTQYQVRDETGRLIVSGSRAHAGLVVEVAAALAELVARCDGDEGVRADGSNIQTIRAHAILAALEKGEA